jgi:hypothetical protein
MELGWPDGLGLIRPTCPVEEDVIIVQVLTQLIGR